MKLFNLQIMSNKKYEELLIIKQKYQKLTDKNSKGQFTKTKLACPKCKIIFESNKIRCSECNRILEVITVENNKD